MREDQFLWSFKRRDDEEEYFLFSIFYFVGHREYLET